MNRNNLYNVTLTLLCAFVLVGSVSAAGSGGFRIEDYIPEKFTDLEWQLNGSLRFSGNDTETNNQSTLDNPVSYISSRDENGSNLVFGSQTVYRYETVARTLKLRAYISGDYSTSDAESSTDRSDDLGLDNRSVSNSERSSYTFKVTPSFEARSYLAGDLFIGTSGSASIQQYDKPGDDYTSHIVVNQFDGDYFYHTNRSYDQDSEYHRRNRSVGLTVGPGWGRAYEGQYAATTLYMVDELRNEGVLEREPSKEEMLELTEIIYQNRMAHEVDHRLAKIDALNAVTAYLTEIGAIAETGHVSYVLIQDVWDFFPRYSRLFGTRLKVGVGWEYNYGEVKSSRDRYATHLCYRYHIDSANVVDTIQDYQESTSEKQTSHSEVDNTFLILGVEHHRPLSTRWQLDASADLFYYLHAEGLRAIPRSSTFPVRPPGVHLNYRKKLDDYYQFYLDCMGTWIYNSRTDLKSALFLSCDHYRTTHDTGDNRWQTHAIWNFWLLSSLTYRISIPTSLVVTAHYTAYSDEVTNESVSKSTTNRWDLSASISHYLF